MSENENPNKLFIIGNGFDLAHGLKTKYEDFIEWYLRLLSVRPNQTINDGIIETARGLEIEYKSIQDYFEILNTIKNHPKYRLKILNPFFINLVNNAKNKNWVDIEQAYFENLKNLFDLAEKNKNFNNFFNEVKALNDQFNSIKLKLIEYFSEMNKTIQPIEELSDNLFDILYISKPTVKDNKSILILDFNYTSIFPYYYSSLNSVFHSYNHKRISIHGDISKSDEIIFGYGDEDDPLYEKLERLNENELLKHFKSFGYFKNEKYQTLNNFIESSKYDVYIIGHSCGISDRVLLSAIFSNENCNKIQIFYHQKNETENDFFEKTQQISRHFKAGMKNEMRKRIVPFNKSKPLVSF